MGRGAAGEGLGLELCTVHRIRSGPSARGSWGVERALHRLPIHEGGPSAAPTGADGSLDSGPQVAAGRLGLGRLEARLNERAVRAFDRWVAGRLGPTDVFHCISSFGVESHRAARERYGALTVCDRGSSHILYQDEVLRDEHARWRVAYHGIPASLIARELEEYETCDVICVPSAFARRSFLERGVPSDKIRRVPLGVDLQLFQPQPKEDSVFRVIYVGHLSLQKGVQYLLSALCAPGMPKIEVWLVGAVADEVKSVLGQYRGRYRYVGVVPRAKLSWYYSQASVFVLASINDGFGLVQAQAMACGLPVVATANTGAEDLFSPGVEGFVVPIRDPEAIRERVLHLYTHRDVREEMGRAALRRVRALGGWDTYGAQAVEAYRAAIDRQRAERCS